jgi:alpha/beta superfamily hydrolase
MKMTKNNPLKILYLSGFLVKPELFAEVFKKPIDHIDYMNLTEAEFVQTLKSKGSYDLAIGFSLGACLLLKYHDLVKANKLLLLAPPANFLRNKHNSFGHSRETMNGFISMLKEDLKTLNKKFNFNNSFPKKELFKYLVDNNSYDEARTDKRLLLDWLFCLQSFDARAYSDCKKEIHILHGLADNVVSYKQSELFKKLFKNVSVTLIEDAPHALFLSHNDAISNYIDKVIA